MPKQSEDYYDFYSDDEFEDRNVKNRRFYNNCFYIVLIIFVLVVIIGLVHLLKRCIKKRKGDSELKIEICLENLIN